MLDEMQLSEMNPLANQFPFSLAEGNNQFKWQEKHKNNFTV